MKISDYFKNPPKIGPYTATMILTLATFMEILDTTIANVCLPHIASGLGVSLREASWVTGAYIIANVAIVPTSAWFAIYFGRKRYYMICVVCFTLSSLLCAISQSLEALVFFRILQGLSGGGLASSEQTIISEITPPEQLGRAFSLYAFCLMVAPICGPTVGGLISDNLGWRWIFLINIPVGILSLFLTGIFIKETDQAKERTKEALSNKAQRDYLGIFLIVCGIASMELYLHEAPKVGWFETQYVIVLAIVASLSLIIGITWEYYHKKPAIDVTLFRYRHLTSVSLLIFLGSFMSTGAVFLFPFMAQSLFGYSATNSGLIFLPGTIVMMITTQIIAVLTEKIDLRWIILTGYIVLAFSQWNLSNITYQADYSFLVWARIFQSFGLSFGAVSLMASAYSGMPSEHKSNISAFTNLARNAGSSLGIAVASTYIVIQTQLHTTELSNQLSNYNSSFINSLKIAVTHFETIGYSAYESSGLATNLISHSLEKQAGILGFIDAFTWYMILYFFMMPLVFLLKSNKKK